MQGTLVTILVILAGLGSQNKESAGSDLPPALNDSAIHRDAGAGPIAPPVYPPYVAGVSTAGYAPSDSVGRVIHQTIVSFFLGHDDDVMTEKEIESAVHAGAYSGVNDSPPSAVLSFEGPR